MDFAAKTIEGRFTERPEIQAARRDTIGNTYQDLAAFAEAEPQLKAALELREACLGLTIRIRFPASTSWRLYRDMGDDDDPDTLRCINNLAVLYQNTADYASAEPLLKRALATSEATRVRTTRTRLHSPIAWQFCTS